MQIIEPLSKIEPVSGTRLVDQLNRPIEDLRVSVIDRCNFRCPYCMPEEDYPKHYKFLAKPDWLNFDEIASLVKVFVKLGVTKVRLTGGEPLLRPNIEKLIEKLSVIKGIQDLALTSNASLLLGRAENLKKSGLRRLTISLDTLDEKVFHQMTGNRGDIEHILNGIKDAQEAGFESLKINAVIQKGLNDHTILDLIEHFRGTKHIIRFIEYMDVGNCNHWQLDQVMTSSEIFKLVNARYPLKAVKPNYRGEVASRYQYLDGKGEVGFISSVTQPFCQSCTRARLSTDGQLYTCLFAKSGINLRTLLKQNSTEADLIYFIQTIWKKRNDQYSELRSKLSDTERHQHKVEMFQIGG